MNTKLINFRFAITVTEHVSIANVSYVTDVLKDNKFSFTFTPSGFTGFNLLFVDLIGVKRLCVLHKLINEYCK